MSRREKRLASMLRNPHGVRIETLESLLRMSGFHPKQGKGDHVVWRHPDGRLISLDRGFSPVKAVYVRKVLQLLGVR